MTLKPLALCCLIVSGLQAETMKIQALASRVPQGGVLVLLAKGATGPLHAQNGEKRHPFFPPPGAPQGSLAVLVPVPVDAPLGLREVKVEAEGQPPLSVPFTVTRTTGASVAVKVAPRAAQPSEDDKARIVREREAILAILATPGGTRTWSAPFRAPGSGVITCGFGATRHFNGVVRSVHKGIDLRAATGTPVFASAAGTVRLAQDLFFGGNLVFLDHGCGLFSSYAHLSRLDVKAGDAVQAGARLGLSGATGRVSAPHLHWGTSIAGVEVDPLLLQKATAALCGAPAPKAVPRKRRR